MDARLQDIFISEIASQCRFALESMQRLRETLEGHEVHGAFLSVQGFLIAAGNISKLLWPTNPRIPQRGEILREALGVRDDSAVGPRRFRNHFEHFDERLEEWAMTSAGGNLVDMNIMPPGTISGIDPKDFLRNLDQQTLILTFRGDSYDLQAVEAEINEINNATLKCLARKK
jgi:hypothetical protein